MGTFRWTFVALMGHRLPSVLLTMGEYFLYDKL